MNSTVLIVYKSSNEQTMSVHQDICKWLSERGFCVESIDSHQSTSETINADFAVSLGGDGTFLSCARHLAQNPIPILPVHMGTFGFIAEVTHTEWKEALASWLRGELEVEQRMILQADIVRSDRIIHRCIGVNDAVISSGAGSKIIRLSLKLGDYEVGNLRGDGVILATATGSTAYSMASGGPIMIPPMNALVLTPICPFSLSWRPMVIPDRDEIVVRVAETRKNTARLTLDGQQDYDLEYNDAVRVRGLPSGIKIIKSAHRVFYEVVCSRLGWSGNPNA